MSKRRTAFSYHAGQRGRNRVRAYRHSGDDKLYLEWWEEGRRRSVKLPRSVQHKARAEAEREACVRADELAAKLARIDREERRSGPTTLTTLFDSYGRERTPLKGASKQAHDRRATRMWLAFFDAQPDMSRRSGRHPSSLDKVDWDRFITWRRNGEIPGFSRHVGDRQVQYDLQFMIAVLNWALATVVDGSRLLEANPWSRESRRGWGAMPTEKNPRRPSMTDEIRNGLIRHGPRNWQFRAALMLGRETGRRNNSIRQLYWSDIHEHSPDVWDVTWRAEADKSGKRQRTPLSKSAIDLLRFLPSRLSREGPVFPSDTDPTVPTPRLTFQLWLRRAKAKWSGSVDPEERQLLRERLRGVGYHSEKRAFVRDPDFRALPAKVRETMTGTSIATLTKVYDEVTVDDLRSALGYPEQRRTASYRE